MMCNPLRCLLLALAVSACCAQDYRYPEDIGFVDVTRAPYHAAGDGITDDTAAIQRAISDNVGRWRTIYLPKGTYLVSDTLRWQLADGNWAGMLKLRGESRDETVIRLVDGAPGFDAPGDIRGGEIGKPVIQTASGLGWVDHRGEPGRKQEKPNGNMAFGNSVFDLTIDTGSGNPGAVGIDYLASNWGMLDRVTIRSGDGGGFAGISFLRMLPGPCLVKRVRIEGFRFGIAARWMDYNIVLEDIELSGQREAGIVNSTNALSIVGLRSDNRVPAIQMTQADQDFGWGLITLVDAELSGGDPERHAIEGNGHWYLRDVRSEGYAGVYQRAGEGDRIERWATVGISPDADAEPLELPLEPAPEWHSNDFSQWANVMDYGAIPGDEIDDSAAIQAAIDSGKPIVYFPNLKPEAPRWGSWWAARNEYLVERPIELRGSLRKLVGGFNHLTGGASIGTEAVLRVVDGEAPEVIIEGLTILGPHGNPITIDTPRPVVVRNGSCSVTVGPRAERLHLIDLASGYVHLEHPVSAWLSQFNPESGTQTKLVNHGGTVWVNGFKTEAFSTCVDNRAGGRMEILGGHIRSHGPSNQRLLDELETVVRNQNADLAFSCTTRGEDDRAYPVEILDIRGPEAHWTLAEDTPRRQYARESVIPRYLSRSAGATGPGPVRILDLPGDEHLRSGPWEERPSKWANDLRYLAAEAGSDARLELAAQLEPGDHRVYLRWMADHKHAARAPLTLAHAGGSSTFAVDQQEHHAEWVFVGTVTAGDEPVRVTLEAAEAGTVVLDGVRFVRTDAIDPRITLRRHPQLAKAPPPPGLVFARSFDQEDLRGFRLLLGTEFPGARGDLAWDRAVVAAGEGSLRLEADFAGGGRYVAAAGHLPQVRVERLRFRTRSENATAIGIRVCDQSGQWHQHRLPLAPDGDWQELTLDPLASPDNHWGGRDDGTFHGEVRQLYFYLSRDHLRQGLAATLHVDELQAFAADGEDR